MLIAVSCREVCNTPREKTQNEPEKDRQTHTHTHIHGISAWTLHNKQLEMIPHKSEECHSKSGREREWNLHTPYSLPCWQFGMPQRKRFKLTTYHITSPPAHRVYPPLPHLSCSTSSFWAHKNCCSFYQFSKRFSCFGFTEQFHLKPSCVIKPRAAGSQAFMMTRTPFSLSPSLPSSSLLLRQLPSN